jgi:hypothetical protein
MANIDRNYVGVALLWLILGMLLGLYVGISADHTFLNLHIVMVLSGFVVLTLYGAIFRLWPQLKPGATAKLQFGAAMLGQLGIAIGTALFDINGEVNVLAASSILSIAGAALLGWLFWTRIGHA